MSAEAILTALLSISRHSSLSNQKKTFNTPLRVFSIIIFRKIIYLNLRINVARKIRKKNLEEVKLTMRLFWDPEYAEHFQRFLDEGKDPVKAYEEVWKRYIRRRGARRGMSIVTIDLQPKHSHIHQLYITHLQRLR